MNKKDTYLSEDQDLLEELESIGAPRDVFEGRERQVNEIQIKAMLRSRKTTVDLGKSTDRYSIVLVALTIAQIVIVCMQFAFDVTSSDSKILGLVLMVTALVIVGLITWKFGKLIKD